MPRTAADNHTGEGSPQQKFECSEAEKYMAMYGKADYIKQLYAEKLVWITA